jgi:hypothetical protein
LTGIPEIRIARFHRSNRRNDRYSQALMTRKQGITRPAGLVQIPKGPVRQIGAAGLRQEAGHVYLF